MYGLRGALALGMASAGIFAGTTLTSLLVAYDATAARREFTLTAVGLAASVALIRSMRQRVRRTAVGVGVVCGLGLVVVAVCGGAFGLLDSGETAAGLAILMPMAACALNPVRRVPRARLITVSTRVLLCLGAMALLATREASAIGGLAVGGLVGARVARRAGRSVGPAGLGLTDFVLLLGIALAVVFYAVAMFWTDPPLVPDYALSPHLLPRRELWRDTLAMIGDYAISGSGLGGSAMVMSSYAWLRHVPFHPHVHNLFLQVALEQGLPGLVGLAGMFLAAGWTLGCVVRGGTPRVRFCAPAAAAALVTLFCSGLFESDLSGSYLFAFLFLPFGLAFGLGVATLAAERPGRMMRSNLPLFAGLAPIALIVAIALWPGALARWHANLGSVLQTRAELGRYNWPDWPIQDQLRRSADVDLEPAIEQYRAALAHDEGNVTAHRRLGQIELSRGHIDSAVCHLEAALRTAHGDRAAARLLAEAYAITGHQSEAVRLWESSGVEQDELQPRLWWYRQVSPEPGATRFQEAIRGLGRPQSARLPH